MKGSRSYTMSARAEAMGATKERIIEAAKALFLEHAYEDVTLAAIAAAAGVSHQTVLNHFESKDGVVLATAEAFSTETLSARYSATPGDVRGAVRALAGEYERFGDANVRWAVTSERLGQLAVLMDQARAAHQEWLQEMFGDRLPTPPAVRRQAVHALHAATDVYTWKLLRRDLRLSRTETEKTMVDLVVGVLEGSTR